MLAQGGLGKGKGGYGQSYGEHRLAPPIPCAHSTGKHEPAPRDPWAKFKGPITGKRTAVTVEYLPDANNHSPPFTDEAKAQGG